MVCHVFKRGRLFWGKLRLDGDAHISRLPLGTTDKRVAREKLTEIRKHREKVAAGLAPPDLYVQAANRPLPDLLSEFLRHLEANRRTPATVATYRKILGKLFARCGWSFLPDVTAPAFSRWRDQSGLHVSTLNNLLGSLSAFFRWLVHSGYVAENPFPRLRVLRASAGSEPYRRSFTQEEMRRLLQVSPPHRRIVYLTAVYTGLRRSEMMGLRWADFYLDVASPYVLARASLAGNKSRKETKIPLHPELVAALRSFRPSDAAAFTPVLSGLVPRLPRFRKDLVAAGIPFQDEHGRRADLHALRDTFITELVLAGNPPEVVMKLARHSDLRVTMKHYVDVRRLPLAEGLSKLPSFSAPSVCPKTCPKLCPNPGLEGSHVVAS